MATAAVFKGGSCCLLVTAAASAETAVSEAATPEGCTMGTTGGEIATADPLGGVESIAVVDVVAVVLLTKGGGGGGGCGVSAEVMGVGESEPHSPPMSALAPSAFTPTPSASMRCMS